MGELSLEWMEEVEVGVVEAAAVEGHLMAACSLGLKTNMVEVVEEGEEEEADCVWLVMCEKEQAVVLLEVT